MRIRSLASLVAVLVIGLAAVAEDQDGIVIKRNIGPHTRPATRPAKPQATISPDAQGILKEMSSAYGALNSLELAGALRFRIEEGGTPHSEQATFTSAFAAPNKFRQEVKDQPLLGCTGQKAFGYSARSNTFVQTNAPAGRAMLRDLPADHEGILPVQNLSLALAVSKDPTAELAGLATDIARLPDENVDGQAMNALKLTLAADKSQMKLLVDPQTHLLRRVEIDYKPVLAAAGRDDIGTALMTVDYATIKPGAAIAPERFAWEPPAGAREMPARPVAGDADDEDDDGHGHVAMGKLDGKPAPDFTLEGLDGKSVKLSDQRGSVVVLDFWATWCPPCVASLPKLDKVYQDLAGKGLKVYAVNLKEEKKDVEEFVADKKLTMPVLLDKTGETAKAYGVNAIPTTVLIGKDGSVKKVLVGARGEEELRKLIAEELK